MPNVEGITLKEAKDILKNLNLYIQTDENMEDESIIKEQIPKKGIEIYIGTKVILK